MTRKRIYRQNPCIANMQSLYMSRNVDNNNNTKVKFYKIVEILLWGLFINIIFRQVMMPAGLNVEHTPIYRIVNIVGYIWSMGLIWMLAKNWKWLYKSSVAKNHLFSFLPMLIGIFIITFVQGLFFHQEEGFYKFVAWEFIPYLACALSLMAANQHFRPIFLRMSVIQGFIVGCLALYVTISYPIEAGRAGLESIHSSTLACCTFLLFLLGVMPSLRAYQQGMIIFSLICYYLLSISYQSRGSSLMLFVVTPVIVISCWLKSKTMTSDQVLKVFIWMGLCFVLCAIIGFFIFPGVVENLIEHFAVGIKGTMDRWFSGEQANLEGVRESFIDEMETSRGAEAKEFIENSTFKTWILGNGIGVGYQSMIMAHGGYWYMVHFGPLHLVLVGGLGLSILFQFLVIAGIIRSWKALKSDPIAAGCFCYLIIYYLGFLKHGPLGNTYNVYMLWIILGLALSLQIRGRTVLQ